MACTNDWYSNIDKGRYTGLVLIDLKKAFDSLHHNLLLKKFEKYGTIGLGLNLFTSYLQGRKQFCKVNSSFSSIGHINCGIPQDSCLGPLLFLIFINDLLLCLKQEEVTMYVDDTTISHSSKYFSILQEDLNRDLVKLKNWLQGTKLSLNATKTQSLIIGSRSNILKLEKQTDVKPYFELEELKIHTVNDIELLGAKIDNKLQWSYQGEQVKAKALQVLGLIKHAKKFLPLSDLQKMYRGIVEPYFSYCCSICGYCGESKLNFLQKIQNRAARIVIIALTMNMLLISYKVLAGFQFRIS